VSYQSDDLSEQAIPYGSGSFEVVRLTYVHKSKCSQDPNAGIYKGIFYSEFMEEGFPGTILIDGQGFFVGFAWDLASFWGDYTIDGKDFGSIGSFYAGEDGDIGGNYSMTGRIDGDYRLFTEYLIPALDNGFADVYPVTQQYFRGATLAGLAGDYEVEDLHTFNEGTATVETGGVITGMTATGCNWSGQITIPDTEFNLFDISLTVTDCGEKNGLYQGKGYQDDLEDLGDGMAIWIYTFNEQGSFSANMTRVMP
jgi:hypothetical protein